MILFLKFLRGLACSLIFGFAMSADTRAALVDVTYTVSGSANNWTYDFTITNNFGGNLDIYAFSPGLPSFMTISAPTLWAPTPGFQQWCYVNCFAPTSDLGSGQTLGGFVAKDTSLTSLTSISFFIAAIDCTLDIRGNCSKLNSNPTFTGVATASTVPLPGALPLLLAGLASFGFLGRRNKRKAVSA